VDGLLYFGGTPQDLESRNRLSSIHTTFGGCIADATIGETLINFASPTAISGAIIGKCPEKGGNESYLARLRIAFFVLIIIFFSARCRRRFRQQFN